MHQRPESGAYLYARAVKRDRLGRQLPLPIDIHPPHHATAWIPVAADGVTYLLDSYSMG